MKYHHPTAMSVTLAITVAPWVLLLAACYPAAPPPAKPSAADGGTVVINPLMIYLDVETGCEYVGRGSGNGGLTPRLTRNGTFMCNNNK